MAQKRKSLALLYGTAVVSLLPGTLLHIALGTPWAEAASLAIRARARTGRTSRGISGQDRACSGIRDDRGRTDARTLFANAALQHRAWLPVTAWRVWPF